MNLNKSTAKVYIVCPANKATGGPLLLHQLADKFIGNGINAMMYYFETENSDPNNPVHEFYKSFNIPFVTKIDDEESNLLVIPETETKYIFKYKKIQKVIWWLSVDNFLITNAKKRRFSFKRLIGLKPKEKNYSFSATPEHYHWSQSAYAIDFLKNKNITSVEYLSDYLDSVFLNEVSNLSFEKLNKENIIAYNPKKGFETTQKLMALTPNFTWVPIENMTPAEVKALLYKSKLYVDFGNHPGKDRIPREAAVCGCIIITNKEGSAHYFEDVAIDEAYKFEHVLEKTSDFINLVESIFNNYAAHVENFKSYRTRISNEEKRFDTDLKNIIHSYFNNKNGND
jgi:hypothetical protein